MTEEAAVARDRRRGGDLSHAGNPAEVSPESECRPRPCAVDSAAGWRVPSPTSKAGVQVSGEGTVSRILGDDSGGDRHQRFDPVADSGRTLLIAHNIDIAPRIDALREGDTVSFSGEYEWNDKGGIVHWTHHDPQGQHEDGRLAEASRSDVSVAAWPGLRMVQDEHPQAESRSRTANVAPAISRPRRCGDAGQARRAVRSSGRRVGDAAACADVGPPPGARAHADPYRIRVLRRTWKIRSRSGTRETRDSPTCSFSSATTSTRTRVTWR